VNSVSLLQEQIKCNSICSYAQIIAIGGSMVKCFRFRELGHGQAHANSVTTHPYLSTETEVGTPRRLLHILRQPLARGLLVLFGAANQALKCRSGLATNKARENAVQITSASSPLSQKTAEERKGIL
jgi:hypothetical protein